MSGLTVPSLVCRVEGKLSALPLEHVVETMRPLPTEPMPGAPPFVLGVSIIRGQPVPVVDLGLLLGGAVLAPGRYVSLRVHTRTVALAVSEVVGVASLSAASVAELPPLLRDESSELVSAIGSLDAELLLVLNAARLVPDSLWSSRNEGAA